MRIDDKSDHDVNCKSDWIDGDFSLVIPNFEESLLCQKNCEI